MKKSRDVMLPRKIDLQSVLKALPEKDAKRLKKEVMQFASIFGAILDNVFTVGQGGFKK